ncbi:MAG: DNA alkylation repair protein, partial [Pseudomonadota bacterium]
RANKKFDRNQFVTLASDGLDALELKERPSQITDALESTLGNDFNTACDMLLAALHPHDAEPLSGQSTDERGIAGWPIMPMADWVARRGLDAPERSLAVLKEMTKRFSAEFAIRHYFVAHPQTTLEKAMEWTRDENEHVRRLASEGSRPRLPWGIRLNGFVDDPAPLLPLLTALRDDESEYVRRSVANNLNDIARDHSDLVAQIAANWLADAPHDRVRLVRHACRSLIKAGHQSTLQALGYGKPEVEIAEFTVTPDAIKLGESITITVELESTAKTEQGLIVDFAMHHRMANGSTSRKVFKWKDVTVAPGESATWTKKVAVKPVTTRNHYPGEHLVELLINGESLGKRSFDLRV